MPRSAGLSIPLRYSYEPSDSTSRTPPNPRYEDPDYGCGPPVQHSCHRFDLGTFTASLAGARGRVHPRVPEALRQPDGLDDETCWTPASGGCACAT